MNSKQNLSFNSKASLAWRCPEKKTSLLYIWLFFCWPLSSSSEAAKRVKWAARRRPQTREIASFSPRTSSKHQRLRKADTFARRATELFMESAKGYSPRWPAIRLVLAQIENFKIMLTPHGPKKLCNGSDKLVTLSTRVQRT